MAHILPDRPLEERVAALEAEVERLAHPEREEPIYVPARDGITPSQMADAMHLLNHAAPHLVRGRFVVLPAGAKVLSQEDGSVVWCR